MKNFIIIFLKGIEPVFSTKCEIKKKALAIEGANIKEKQFVALY